MERLLFIGGMLIIFGIVFIIISTITMGIKSKNVSGGDGKSKVDVAFGGFIGPIPFGFFSNKNAFYLWLVVLTAGVVFWLVGKNVVG